MSEILTAIYQDGAFVPEQATNCVPGSRVRLVIEPAEPYPTTAAEALCNHTPPTDEDWEAFERSSKEIAEKVRGFKRLTRDELHERR